MKIKRTSAVGRSIKASRLVTLNVNVLSDNHHKIEAFVAILVTIHRKESTNKSKATKCKYNKPNKGSQSYGPLFLFVSALSFIIDRYKTRSMVNTYDRYYSTTSFSGFIPNY